MAFKVKALNPEPSLTRDEKSEEYPLFEIDSASVAGTEEEVIAETADYVRPLKYAVVVAPEVYGETEGKGALPEGLAIPEEGTEDDDKVVLSGTPTVTGEFEVLVKVTDAGDREPTATTDGENNYVIIKIKIEARTVTEEIANLFAPAEGDPEWKSITLGTTGTLQQIASAALKASELLDANVKFAQGILEAAGVFLMGLFAPYIALLRLIADTIDDFVKDFKNIGFYILEVVPSGKEILPADADGNPIKMVVGALALPIKAASAAAIGQTASFSDWASRQLNETDIYLTGPKKEGYLVPVGKGKVGSLEKSDGLAEYDPVLGMYKMTPSQVIATMITAFDDPGDTRRPQFSDTAATGAIVIVAGFADFSKNLSTIYDALQAILLFFGGEPDEAKNQPGGVLTAVSKLATLMGASLGFMQDGTKNEFKVKIESVCGVRGTEEDKITLNMAKLPYCFAKEDGAKTPHKFSVGDYVIGPRVKLGLHCMGIVSSIDKEYESNVRTEIKKEGFISVSSDERGQVSYNPKKYEDKPRKAGKFSKGNVVTQEMTIQGVTNMDKICFTKLGNGAKLQRVAFKESWMVHVDENSGETIKNGPNNYYEYLTDLGTGKISSGLRGEYKDTAYNYQYMDRFSGSTVTIPKDEMNLQQSKLSYGPGADPLISPQFTEDKTVSLQTALDYPSIYGDINAPESGQMPSLDQKNKDGLLTVGSENGKAALTKVSRKDGESAWETLLTPGPPEDITEDFKNEIVDGVPLFGSDFTTLNNVVGNVRLAAPPKSTHPDFKAVKMEDLIEDWSTFFSAIDALTDALRKMADDATKAIQDIIDYLDAKIAELERINQALQAILKLFTTGLGDAGIYVLNIPTEAGGVNRIKTQLQSAPNRPPDTLDFSMGFLLMSGGAQATGFKVIQKLLIGED